MIIITYIYYHNERTKQTVDSFKALGYEVAIIEKDTHRGNGEALRSLYECYKRAATGHTTFCYADAADSYCQRQFFLPSDRLIYSTEKACYPHPEISNSYPRVKSKYKDSPWKYLNGGGYGGSLEVMIEFIERYHLHELRPDANGQHEQMMAYISAKDDGFPISLDDGCETFQTMAFADPSEFEVKKIDPKLESKSIFPKGQHSVLKNIVTKNVPAILHFNGLTPMNILNELR